MIQRVAVLISVSAPRLPPDKRLKLAALRLCGGHQFANVEASRRSLGAIRYTVEGDEL